MKKTYYINKMESENLLKKGEALDLGFGMGNDILTLAQLGYSVSAVDIDEDKVKALKEKISAEGINDKVNVIATDISDFIIKPKKYAVILCANVLPFIADKKSVEKLISNMANGLTRKGVMYFSLFGPNDSWSQKTDMSFFGYHEAIDILKLLPVSIYERSTTEGYGKTMKGDIKYWHIHRFICIKK